jgi:hypothetical protein
LLSGEDSAFKGRLETAIDGAKDVVLVDRAGAADIVLIDQLWKSRNWHDLHIIESCAFIAEQAEKILTISHDDFATIFLPGLYVSLTNRINWLGWVMPSGYKRQYRSPVDIGHVATTAERRWLFSFRGADFSHPVRKKLSAIYAGAAEDFRYVVVNKTFHSHTEADHKTYLAEILASHYVLAPRGMSPSSYRMFEAMQNGRCPVIISDDWQPIAGIDWKKCSIRVAEKDVAGIYAVLHERVAESEALGRQAREVWAEHFADGVREQRMVRELLELHRNCDRPRDIESLKRLWRSRAFFQAHGWTLGQRLQRRFKSFVSSHSRT